MTKKGWRWVFMVIVATLGLMLLFLVRKILSPFLIAFIMAYLLSPFINWLEKRHIRRSYAVAIVFSGILGGMAALFLLAIPNLYSELTKLVTVLPQKMKWLNEYLTGVSEGFKNTGLPSKVTLVIDQHLSQGEAVLAESLKSFLEDLPEMFSTMGLLILSPILAIYFLADWKKLERSFIRIVPSQARVGWQRIIQDISHVIRRFIRGDIIVALIVGILTGIGVKLIGMDYAVLIGLLSGISDLIPYFGPIIGAVPALLLALIKSPAMAIKVGLVILVVQQLESNIISPKIVGDQVGLHPIFIIFALLAGGELFGVIGMLLAVPFAGVIQVILKHLYFRLVSPDIERH